MWGWWLTHLLALLVLFFLLFGLTRWLRLPLPKPKRSLPLRQGRLVVVRQWTRALVVASPNPTCLKGASINVLNPAWLLAGRAFESKIFLINEGAILEH